MEELFLILVNYGWIGIAVVALSEAIFLPIPVDTISIPIYLLNREKAILYSILLILFSLIGSSVGYYIGRKFGKKILLKIAPKKMVEKVEKLYSENSSTAIISSAFTPIPYEIYVFSAGVFNIKFSNFMLYVLISRTLRHLPQGILIQLFGEYILSHLKSYSIAL
ncbi:MAG: YqaA family protein, partial [Fusobacteriaceae bacterium]